MRPIIKKLLLNTHGIVRNGLVAEYRFNEGAGQVLYDYRSNNNGQLGSAAGADTNDPTWTAGGLTFATDDYCAMPVPFNVNENWAVYIAGKRDGNPSVEWGEAFCSMGISTGSNPQLYVFKGSTGFLRFYVHTGTFEAYVTFDTFPAGFNMLVAKRNGDNYTLKNLTTGQVGAFVRSGTLTGVDVCTLGVRRRNALDLYLNGEISYYLPYSRATSDAEDTQNYRALKTILAGRGVSI